MISRYKYHILAFLAGASWSTLAIFTAYASKANVEPFSQVFWRLSIGSLSSLLVGLTLFKIDLTIHKKELAYFLTNAFLFVCGFTTFSASIFLGSPIAKAIALNYSYPLAVIVLSYLLFRHLPTLKNIFAVFLSFFSVFLLLEVWKIKNLTQIGIGDFLAWLNSFAFAAIIVWGTKIRQDLIKISPFKTIFYSWLLAIPMLFIFGFLMKLLNVPFFLRFLNKLLRSWLASFDRAGNTKFGSATISYVFCFIEIKTVCHQYLTFE